MITVFGLIAIAAILFAIWLGHRKQAGDHPLIRLWESEHGWIYKLDHNGTHLHDGYYKTKTAAIEAALFEHGRLEADR